MSIKKKIIKSIVAIKIPFILLGILSFVAPVVGLPTYMMDGTYRPWFIYSTVVMDILTFTAPVFAIGMLFKIGITLYLIWRK